MRNRLTVSLALVLTAGPAAGQQLLHSIDGTDFLGLLGWAVSSAGDVNADGFDDFIIGGRRTGPNGEGVARVYSGVDASTIYELFGAAPDDEFGVSVSPAGDVDADGVPDFVIGADSTGGGGSVYVYSGADGSELHHFQGDGRLGHSVAGAGDVDADGYDDIVAGAIFGDGDVPDSGAAFIYSGLDGSVLHSFSGTAAFSGFGRAVDGAGDIDHDGYDDVVITAYREISTCDGVGAAMVFSGADGSVLFDLNAGSLEAFGESVAGGEDVNADGYPDVIVGACGGLQGNGSARVFSGRDGSVLFTRHGQDLNDEFGRSVDLLPDSDGDGFADFIVGIPSDDNSGAGSGSVRVYSGRTGTVMHHIFGGGFLDQFGRAVAAAGKVNGDGATDFIIGMPYADPNESGAGNAQVYTANPISFESYCDATFNSTGSIAHIYAESGASTSVSANIFELNVTGVPPVQFGLFFYGSDQADAPFGNGNLCVSSNGGLFRLNPPQQTSASGELTRLVDLTDPPELDGQITAGSTWNFQFWYRDPTGGGSLFNLSDGLSVTFEP